MGTLRPRASLRQVFLALLAACAMTLAAFSLPTPAHAADLGEPELSEAQAALVMDQTGAVLYEKNPDEQINMASITKVMTAVVALESGMDLDASYDLVGCELDENAIVAGYQAGMTSTLRDLLRVMLVRSANDAAYEVATIVGGSEEAFVERMNDKAAELGMTGTHFENPHGLDAQGHHSTVADLAKLGRYALTSQPLIADTVRLGEVTAPIGDVSLTFTTTDQFLLEYPGALGIKTGMGDEVSSFLGAARRDGVTLYACVLGCTTSEGRFADTEALMDWAFGAYQAHGLSVAGLPLAAEPFSYHFGMSCLVQADADVTGLTWPAGGPATFTRIMSGQVEPGETAGVCQWSQDGRCVGTATYSSSRRLVRTRSGLGYLEALGSYREHLAAGTL